MSPQIAMDRLVLSADIVLCVDVTGSMQPCLDKLKASMQRFARDLETWREVPREGIRASVGDWRIRVVGFRDLEHQGRDPSMILDLPFVSTPQELAEQFKDPRLRAAGGGGDGPESTLDAVYLAATRSPWRQKRDARRFIILFGDARPRPSLHPSTVEPGLPTNLEEVVQALLVNRVRLCAFAVDDNQRSLMALENASNWSRRCSRFFPSRAAANRFFGDPDLRPFQDVLENVSTSIFETRDSESL